MLSRLSWKSLCSWGWSQTWVSPDLVVWISGDTFRAPCLVFINSDFYIWGLIWYTSQEVKTAKYVPPVCWAYQTVPLGMPCSHGHGPGTVDVGFSFASGQPTTEGIGGQIQLLWGVEWSIQSLAAGLRKRQALWVRVPPWASCSPLSVSYASALGQTPGYSAWVQILPIHSWENH